MQTISKQDEIKKVILAELKRMAIIVAARKNLLLQEKYILLMEKNNKESK